MGATSVTGVYTPPKEKEINIVSDKAEIYAASLPRFKESTWELIKNLIVRHNCNDTDLLSVCKVAADAIEEDGYVDIAQALRDLKEYHNLYIVLRLMNIDRCESRNYNGEHGSCCNGALYILRAKIMAWEEYQTLTEQEKARQKEEAEYEEYLKLKSKFEPSK